MSSARHQDWWIRAELFGVLTPRVSVGKNGIYRDKRVQAEGSRGCYADSALSGGGSAFGPI